MPPNDSPLGTPADPTTPAAQPVAGAPGTPATPAGVTVDDVKTVVRETMQQFAGELTSNVLAPLQQSVAGIQARFEGGAPGAAEGAPDPILQPAEFTDAAVKKGMEQVEGAISPVLTNALRFSQATSRKDAKEQIDAEFGPGAFDTHIADGFDATVKTITDTDPARLTPEAIVATLATIKGSRFTELAEAKTTFEKEKADRPQPPGMLAPGGGTLSLDEGQPSEDVKTYVAERNQNGAKLDATYFAKIHTPGRPMTLTDWQDLQPKKEAPSA